MNECGNCRLPPGFDPWTVQPTTIRCIDYGIPVQVNGKKLRNVNYIFIAIEANCCILGIIASENLQLHLMQGL